MSAIRNPDGTLAITPGAWKLSPTGCNLHKPEVKLPPYVGGASREAEQQHQEQRWANAALIAEAGTVTNETNRTPAELRDLVRELRKAIEMYLEVCELKYLTRALAKSEGV